MQIIRGGFSWSSYWTPPSGLIATVISLSQVNIAWTGGRSAIIERSTDGITYTEIDTVAEGVVTYSDTNVVLGFYYYRVREYSGTHYSDYTNVATADIDAWVLTKITTFQNTITTAGLWAKLDLINLGFAGDSAYLNLKTGAIVASLGDATTYYEDRVGFFADGDNGYMNYTWNPSTVGNNYSLNSAYVGVYTWENIGEAGIICGCNDGAGYLDLTLLKLDANRLRFRFNSNATTKYFTYTGRTDGYISMRKSNNNVYVDRNGAQIGTTTVITTSVPNQNIVGLANSSSGAIGSNSINKLGALIAGSYLTEAEDLTLYTALNTLVSQISNRQEYYDKTVVLWGNYGGGNKQIIGVHGNYMFAFSVGYVHMSNDSGATWNSKALATAIDCDFCYIWDTGTVNFAVDTKMYRSTDLLLNYAEISPVLPGGAPYSIHVPVNATYPGKYYEMLNFSDRMYRGGTEFLVWGNYQNLNNGASPINIYSLENDGVNLTVIYQWGQNPNYKDDGTANGGTTGNLLGDATNPLYCKHHHTCAWDGTDTVYFYTGDDNFTGPIYEDHWGKLVYATGAWTPTILLSSAYRAVGFFYDGGYIYYASETAGSEGVYRTTIANIPTIANHELLLATAQTAVAMMKYGDELYVTEYAGDLRISVSKNKGITWDTITLHESLGFPRLGFTGPMGYKDADGYQWFYLFTIDKIENPRIKMKII